VLFPFNNNYVKALGLWLAAPLTVETYLFSKMLPQAVFF